MNRFETTLKQAVPRRRMAFTLIEMLVVIGIIAILAGIIVSALPALQEKAMRSKLEAKKAELITAIENYKATKGFWPPDNKNDPTLPPLLYELTGTVTEGAEPRYLSVFDPNHSLTPTVIQKGFGTSTFLHSGAEKTELKNFFKNLQPSAVKDARVPGGNETVKVICVPYPGPDGKDLNPWRYVSTNPTNNPSGFDLWAEVRYRNRIVTIKNW